MSFILYENNIISYVYLFVLDIFKFIKKYY